MDCPLFTNCMNIFIIFIFIQICQKPTPAAKKNSENTKKQAKKIITKQVFTGFYSKKSCFFA